MRVRLPYWVSVYRDGGAPSRDADARGRDGCAPSRAELVCAQWCPDEALARYFAMNTLLDFYLLLIYPRRDDHQRLFWCELVPGRRVDGRWEPGIAVDGEVDTAYLDACSGEISWDLAACTRRWWLPRQSPAANQPISR